MKKNPFASKKPSSGVMALQITSMADIFTILLVFLLKSFSTSASNITPTAGLKLPSAVTDTAIPEAPKVEIARDAVLVEDKPVSTLSQYRFSPKDLGEGGVSKGLAQSLKMQKKRQELIAQSNSDVQVEGKILILADEKVPYITLKSVLVSAALEGFSDFKLVVVKKE